MEDCNSLVADCVVISCCCQCLILQVVVFFLVRLPHKAAERTRRYATKLRMRCSRKRKREGGSIPMEDELVKGSCRLIELELEEFSAIEEVEKVLEELSLEGEFVFGSFWGRGRHFTGNCLAGTQLFVQSIF